MRGASLLLALLLAGPAIADSTRQEVDYLINFVASSECTFFRNNSAHDSVAAAAHLRRKYEQGLRWINSAEQFIDRIASGSSISGRAYHVDCAGREQSSADWLTRALAQYRESITAEKVPSATRR
jgi:hypothetical protein